VLAGAGLGEESRETVVVGARLVHESTVGLQVSERRVCDRQMTHAEAVLDGIQLPASVSNLDTWRMSVMIGKDSVDIPA
jgi:hypothetical protein